MMNTFMDRFRLTNGAAAKEAGLLFCLNEKTMRTWWKDFYVNMGNFSESKRGKHERPFILQDENCRRKAAQWVRSDASIKGHPSMTAAKFCE